MTLNGSAKSFQYDFFSLFLAFVFIFPSFHVNAFNSEEIQKPEITSLKLGGKAVPVKIEVLADNLNFAWSLAFLPDNSFLISEKPGNLRRLKNTELSEPLSGVPEVFYQSQGGLFDVITDKDFESNKTIYLSYASGDMKANTTSVISAQLEGLNLKEVKNIFNVEPTKNTPVHYGGKLLQLPDNTLVLTTGDGFDYREQAQDTKGLLGKLVRFNKDGSIPDDNPFVNNADYHPAIFSLGHRNPQGLVYDFNLQQIVMHEHGPAGGDEINLIKAGKNYGWPIATHGKDYSGASISPFKEYKGLEQPLIHWTPSIAPSGLAIYSGNQFPEIEGHYLVGALAARELRLVEVSADKVIKQQSLLKSLNARIRDVRVGPAGAIYILTDGEKGQLIKISRK